MKGVEVAAQINIPFSLTDPVIAKDSENGIDGIAFDFGKLLDFWLKLYKLDDAHGDLMHPLVEFSTTLDGADLLRNILHVTAGININDPISGFPIGYKDLRKIQSRKLCWPFKIIIAKDSKTLCANHFSDFFTFLKQVEECSFGTYTCGFLIRSPQGFVFAVEVYREGWCLQAKCCLLLLLRLQGQRCARVMSDPLQMLHS
jgi:hypothetical protein